MDVVKPNRGVDLTSGSLACPSAAHANVILHRKASECLKAH